jgi:putative redox protein
MNTVDCRSAKANEYPQVVQIRSHTFSADVGPESGSTDSAPGPHDYFDAALASCKALTAIWYARKNGYPLERVETKVESDSSQERAGVYRMKVQLRFHGPLSDEQRERLHRAVAKCPTHKLMTEVDVQIETVAPA